MLGQVLFRKTLRTHCARGGILSVHLVLDQSVIE